MIYQACGLDKKKSTVFTALFLANNCNFDTNSVFNVCVLCIYNPTNYINNKRNNIDC